MYIIEYEQALKKWIVFKKEGNLLFQVYADKLKRNCKKWIDSKLKGGDKNGK